MMIRLFIVITVIIFGSTADAMAASKVALIIGNAAYRGSHVPQLSNPLNDVFVMRQALEAADFKVYSFTDLTRSGMSRALDEFEAASSDADIGVVYYSGHGMEIAGKNFLIPIDAVLASERDAKYEAIELGDVLAALAHVKLLKLVLLDACRDNPQLDKMRVANKSIGGASKGLARIDDLVEGNLLIAYATAPGETATDGVGVNSPFASALADHLVEPGVEVEAALRSVARDVYRSTDGKQRPYKTGSIFETVSLGRTLPKAEPNLDVNKCRDAAAHWAQVSQLKDRNLINEHLTLFGECAFASLAKHELTSLNPSLPEPATPPETEDNSAAASESGRDVLSRSLQAELKRVGCYIGNVDGRWGSQSTMALRTYSERRKVVLDFETPTPDALNALKTEPERVCPLICGILETESNGRCVAKTCSSGELLDRKGVCTKQGTSARGNVVSSSAKNKQQTRKSTASTEGCFIFAGEKMCP